MNNRTQDTENLYALIVQRLVRVGAKDPTSQILALAKEVEQYRTKIRTLEEELDKRGVIIRLLEGDVADRDKMLEQKVEEVYADFMRDYRCMREELEGYNQELAEMKKERDTLKKAIDKYRKGETNT